MIEDPVVCSRNDIVCWMWPKGVASSIDVFNEDREESEDVENTMFSSRFVKLLKYVLKVREKLNSLELKKLSDKALWIKTLA